MKEKRCLHCGSNEFLEKNEYSYCVYCGSKYIKRPEDQEVLLATAYQDLRTMSFLEAEIKFEDIIQRYPRLPEAYWGCVCAKYGIKFEQSQDGRSLPTCCLPAIESFTGDAHFKKAVNISDMETSDWYLRQGEYIDNARKTWLDIVTKNEPYDIFISYKDSDQARGYDRTDDSIDAQELYIHLREQGYRVFYSRESLRSVIGDKYEPHIFHALNTAKVMIIFGSKLEYINSTWLKNEWQRYQMKMAQGAKKQGSLLVIYKDLNPGDLPAGLRNVQALNWNSRSCFQDLDTRLKAFVRPAEEERRLEEEARRAQAEAEKKAKEEEERQKREAKERELAAAKAAKAEAAAAKKQKKREYRQAHSAEIQKTVRILLSILIPLVLLAGAMILAVLFENARHWIIGGAIIVAYSILGYLLAKRVNIWLYMTANILISITVIPFMAISDVFRIYAVCLAGAVFVSSLVCWIKSGIDKEDDAEFWVPHVFWGVDGILLVIGISLFLPGYALWLTMGIGIVVVYCAYSIIGSLGSEDFQMFAVFVNILVGIAGFIFFFISREFSLLSMFILFATTVSAPFIFYDLDGEGFMYSWWFLAWLAALGISIIVFFAHWGLSDFTVRDNVLVAYRGKDTVVVIPDNVTVIGESAMKNRGKTIIEEVIMPDSVEVIEYAAFMNCTNLKKVQWSANLKSIGESAFHYSGLREVSLPSKVTYIGPYAFNSAASLTQITLPEGLAEIGANAFAGTNIHEIVIPNSVIKIGASAFFGTKIKEVDIPDSVEELGANCFDGCKQLKTVYLGSGLLEIGNTLFRDAPLEKIYYNGTDKDWENVVKNEWSLFGAKQMWDHEAGNYELICEPIPDRTVTEAGEIIARPMAGGCASTIGATWQKGTGGAVTLICVAFAAVLTRRRKKEEA